MARIEANVALGRRYRLGRRIAVGGMGAVWEAEDTVLDRRVAVKVLSDGLAADETFVERFRREAQAAAGLSHPNVAEIFDFGEDEGSPYIVMEFIEGETLAARIARGPLDPDEAVRIGGAIAEALQAAHEAGIVHRDVKPGNVMLTPEGGIRVMDFGIAAAAWAAPLTVTGTTMGTAKYLSPEQAAGHKATPASDIYALGVVLYEMLAGRPPFTGDSPVAVAGAHVHEDPRPLREVAPHTPEHLAAAVHEALAKDPANRPVSAAAFASMLRSPVAGGGAVSRGGGEPTEALPVPEPTTILEPARLAKAPRVKRPQKRPGVPVVGVAVLVAALVLLGAVVASLLGKSSSPGLLVQVPRVVGMGLEDAKQELDAAGLHVGEVRRVEGQKDVVVNTDPPPGSELSRGSAVTLFVGSGTNEESQQGQGPGGGDGGGDEGDHGKGKGKKGKGGGDD